MSTYSALRDRALARVNCVGQSEAETLAAAALEEAMRFVSFHVRVPSLIASATATAPADPTLEANAITLGALGFNISSTFQVPDRLFVKKDSGTVGYGTPYEFREYHHFLDLQAIPSASRDNILYPAYNSEIPQFCYTITPDSKVWCNALTVDNVLTLFYKKTPAAYAANGVPEINILFDHILTTAAELVLKEWLREPDIIVSMWDLFSTHLLSSIEEYDRQLNSGRKRRQIKIHRSYRV